MSDTEYKIIGFVVGGISLICFMIMLIGLAYYTLDFLFNFASTYNG